MSDNLAPLLSVRGVTLRFGGVVALDDVTFDVMPGQIAGLIGPNGAGKTTLFNCLSRLYQPSAGEILFEDQSVLSVPRHKIPTIGIGRTFQNVALFDRLTVLENVMVGRHSRTSAGFVENALRLPSVGREEAAVRRKAMELIEFMNLGAFTNRVAAGLPFPIRKRVELARALAAEPKLLLLDEPAAGLNHDEVHTLEGQIRRVRDVQGVTVLLVEHHMSLVMSVSDKVVVVNFGRKIADGRPRGGPREPRGDPRLSGYRCLMTAVLEAKGLSAWYGPIRALYDLDLAIEQGGVTALLGANGAGKTTTLRALCNMVRRSGSTSLLGTDITRRSTEDIVRMGVAHVPEGRGTFFALTVEENLRLAFHTRRDRAAARRDMDLVFDYFPRLKERLHQQAGTLSGGEQQMLAVGRALMLGPKLMLLDEPSFGLAPLVVREIFRILRQINEHEHVSMLIVEQNAALALDLADQVYLLETGKVVTSGPSALIQNDEALRKAYLGY